MARSHIAPKTMNAPNRSTKETLSIAASPMTLYIGYELIEALPLERDVEV